MFAGFSSIFHLAVISLERLHATLRPFRHRQLSLKAYWVAIATPWMLSLSLSISIYTLERFRRKPHRVALIIAIICLATSFLKTCFSYLAIWKKIRINKSRKCDKLPTKPRSKIFKEHFSGTAASFMTWTPSLYCNVALYMATSVSRLIPVTVFFFIKLFQYSNSFVNFVIYFIKFLSYCNRKARFSFCRFAV